MGGVGKHRGAEIERLVFVLSVIFGFPHSMKIKLLQVCRGVGNSVWDMGGVGAEGSWNSRSS